MWFIKNIKNGFYLIVFLIISCSNARENFLQTALDLDFVEKSIQGENFLHKVYANKKAFSSKTLHVYIDGDGSPWKKEPTSRNPLILRLMSKDKEAAILLGRPCYHGLQHSLNCKPDVWRNERYSKEVVESMAKALKNWLRQYPATQVNLIGFSGGGTLAVLMAKNIPQIKQIMTLAANLDTDAWSQYHGYSSLQHSLNPISEGVLPANIKQFHLAGTDDDNVPAFIVKKYALQQKAVFKTYSDFNHQCCWEDIWQQVLIENHLNEHQP